MKTAWPSFHRVFAEDAETLASHVTELEDAEVVGVDVEMGQRLRRLPGGVTKGEQILALIQIAGKRHSLICDPLRIRDVSPLAPLLAGEATKVFLGGATDIQLLEDRGLPVHHVVDLAEVAISVFGHKEEGMRALADRALGIQIDKSIRREDWLRRPINPAMVRYAHQDAELTLQLYDWFQAEHSEAVAAHARKHFHPALSSEIPDWIRKFLTKRLDANRLLKEMGIDPAAQEKQLVRDIRLAESHVLSPAQRRRLIRLIGDLRLTALYDEVLPYTSSPSAVFRASAARTLGRLRDERARQVLEELQLDPIGDVASAAELALSDLATKETATDAANQEEESQFGLKPSAVAKLDRLRSSLLAEERPPLRTRSAPADPTDG